MDPEDYAELDKQIEEGYLADDLEPLRCINCESTEFKEEVKSTDGGHVSEKESRCAACDKVMGYWAFGGWLP